MKILTFLRMSLVLGLALGVLVFWAAAAPTVISEDTFVGGLPDSVDGCPCTGTTAGSPCGSDCGGGTYVACNVGSAPSGEVCYVSHPGVESCISTPDCTTGDAACGTP